MAGVARPKMTAGEVIAWAMAQTAIATAIVRDGAITLEPPGLTLPLAVLFA